MISPWIVTAILAVALAVAVFGYVYQRRVEARLRFLFGGGRHTYSESILQMERELSRARRFERRLSVAVLRIVESPAEDSGIRSWGFSSYGLVRYLMLGASIRGQLREYDIIAYPPELDRYALLLAECTQQQARKTAERIVERAWQLTGVRLQGGVAEFPTHGFVLEDLFTQAHNDASGVGYVATRPGIVRAGEGG